MLKLLKNSENLEYHELRKVQDPYSMRCVPQVHGAVNAFEHLKEMAETDAIL